MTVVILSPWINVYQTGVHTQITIYYEQSETNLNLVNPKIITLIIVVIVFFPKPVPNCLQMFLVL